MEDTTTTVSKPGLFGKVYNSIFGISPSPFPTEVISNAGRHNNKTASPEEDSEILYDDSMTNRNTSHNSNNGIYNKINGWLGRQNENTHSSKYENENNRSYGYEDSDNEDNDIYEDTRSRFSVSSRRSSELAPPMTPSRRDYRDYNSSIEDYYNDIDDDEIEINNTMSIIKDSKRRWYRKDRNGEDFTDLPGKFPRTDLDSAPHSGNINIFPTDQDEEMLRLINKIDDNNSILLNLANNAEILTKKADLQKLQAEKDELQKNYNKMREDYKIELDSSKRVYDNYYDLVLKYRELKKSVEDEGKELTQVKGDLRTCNREVKDLEAKLRDSSLSEKRLQNIVDDLRAEHDELISDNMKLKKEIESGEYNSKEQLLEYKNQYNELTILYKEKLQQNNQLREINQNLEKQLEDKQFGSTAMPPLSPSTLKTVNNRAFEDLYPLIAGDSTIDGLKLSRAPSNAAVTTPPTLLGERFRSSVKKLDEDTMELLKSTYRDKSDLGSFISSPRLESANR